ncbi:unnamed protein product [Closterium sp. NIES-54]
MRAVLHCVTSARIEVEGRKVAEIGPGLLVLLGLQEGDTEDDSQQIRQSILSIPMWPGEEGEDATIRLNVCLHRSSTHSSLPHPLLWSSLLVFPPLCCPSRPSPLSSTCDSWLVCFVEKGLDLLVVSQFTLFGQSKGTRLNFHAAMAQDKAEPIYRFFLHNLGEAYDPAHVHNGMFGIKRMVSLTAALVYIP